MLNTVQFSGRQFHPDLDSALKAHGLKRAAKTPTEQQGEEKPANKSGNTLRVAQRQLPGLHFNNTVYKDGKPYVHIMEAEDQERYPGVITLTDDKAGHHLTLIPKDLYNVFIAQVYAKLATMGLVKEKKPGLDLDNYYKTLDALWNPEEMKDDAGILEFGHKRVKATAQRLRDSLEASRERERLREEQRQNRWYRRLWRWAFGG